MLDSRPDRDIIGMANDRTVYRIGMKNPRLCYVGFFRWFISPQMSLTENWKRCIFK